MTMKAKGKSCNVLPPDELNPPLVHLAIMGRASRHISGIFELARSKPWSEDLGRVLLFFFLRKKN